MIRLHLIMKVTKWLQMIFKKPMNAQGMKCTQQLRPQEYLLPSPKNDKIQVTYSIPFCTREWGAFDMAIAYSASRSSWATKKEGDGHRPSTMTPRRRQTPTKDPPGN